MSSGAAQIEQVELGLEGAEGGVYEIAGSKATWRNRDAKVIELSFAGKKFKVTREGRGVAGNPRFHVNGYTQPDGKLLQGRSIVELVETLHRFGTSIVRRLDRIERKIDARFDRLEETIGAGKSRRANGNSKLCGVPVHVEWEQKRYIPRNAPGAFARVPKPLIDGSRNMGSGEYRLLQAVLILAQGTGLLTAGKHRLADLAKIDTADVKRCRDSLVNRGILRATGRKLVRGVMEYELLTHPWLIAGDFTDQWGEESTATGGNSVTTGGTVPPNKTSPQKKSSTEDESRARDVKPRSSAPVPHNGKGTRAVSAGKDSARKKAAPDNFSDEDELLGRIGEFVGLAEVSASPPQGNRGLWINLIREDRVAMREALGEAKIKRDASEKPKTNWAALIKDLFNRIRDERMPGRAKR